MQVASEFFLKTHVNTQNVGIVGFDGLQFRKNDKNDNSDTMTFQENVIDYQGEWILGGSSTDIFEMSVNVSVEGRWNGYYFC